MPVERVEGSSTGRTDAELEEEVRRGILLGTLDKAVSWARKQSMWPARFGLACCAIEMMSTGAGDYDLSRWGMELFRGSPRQADRAAKRRVIRADDDLIGLLLGGVRAFSTTLPEANQSGLFGPHRPSFVRSCRIE